MSRFLSRMVAGAAASLALVAADASPPPTVSWENGKLSVVADQALRADLMKEVARHTGAQLHGVEALRGRVTLRLQREDLRTAVRFLAGDASYALVERLPAPGAGSAPYEISFIERGLDKPTRDVMSIRQPVTVLVEDPATGQMVAQPLSPAQRKGYPSQVRPDREPVSVNVLPE